MLVFQNDPTGKSKLFNAQNNVPNLVRQDLKAQSVGEAYLGKTVQQVRAVQLDAGVQGRQVREDSAARQVRPMGRVVQQGRQVRKARKAYKASEVRLDAVGQDPQALRARKALEEPRAKEAQLARQTVLQAQRVRVVPRVAWRQFSHLQRDVSTWSPMTVLCRSSIMRLR